MALDSLSDSRRFPGETPSTAPAGATRPRSAPRPRARVTFRHSPVKKLHADLLPIPRRVPASPSAPLPETKQKKAMRTYLSFPRGTRIPSPRILFTCSDEPAQARRSLALALTLVAEFPTASVVLATGADDLSRLPNRARIEVVKLPGLTVETPARPLARERIRRLRQRLLCTLFDSFLPDLVLYERPGGASDPECGALLVRAGALESAVLPALPHEGFGTQCVAPGDGPETELCPACGERMVRAVRQALSERGQG